MENSENIITEDKIENGTNSDQLQNEKPICQEEVEGQKKYFEPLTTTYFEWNEEYENNAKEQLAIDSSVQDEKLYDKLESNAKRNWDIFYKNNKTNFFKDRHYIDKEFPIEELMDKKIKSMKSINPEFDESSHRFIFHEVGCAVGNTIFPISKKYCKRLKVFGYDFSPRAIQMIKDNSEYDTQNIEVAVVDLVNDPVPENFPNADFVTCIFILCAISPENHFDCLKKLYNSMKDNSYLYFRDYGRYDQAQLKLAKKNNSKLKENFYRKEDGTRCFYFDIVELKDLAEKVGFEVIDNDVKYRVIENRKENVKMRRVWVQSLFYKK